MELVGDLDPSLEPLLEPISEQIAAGIVARGAQIEIHQNRDVLASVGMGTDGIGRPVTPEGLFAVYCSAKPVTALSVAKLIEEDELSWNDQLGDVIAVELPERTARCTIEAIMTHTAGLHRLRAEEMLSSAPSERLSKAAAHQPPPVWSPHRDLAYSNFLGWYWLDHVIESLTGDPVMDVVSRDTLEPLGLKGSVYVGFREDEVHEAAERCLVNVDLTDRTPIPMLLERAPSHLLDADLAAAGGYATMRGLATFYDELLAHRRGEADSAMPVSSDLLDTMTSPRVSGRSDLILKRDGPWGLGFMVQLSKHRFGDQASAASFGHSGNAGASFAFCDPDHELSVAVLYSAKIDDQLSVRSRRQAFINRLYDLLGLAQAAPNRRG